MTNKDDARLLVPSGKPGLPTSSSASSIKSNKLGRLKNWFYIFSKNISRTRTLDPLKIGERIEEVTQLVHCARLLQSLESSASPLSSSLRPAAIPGDATGSPLSKEDTDWLQAVENKSVEKDRIRQLLIGIVSEFINDPIKDSEAIREVVLVGPVLERGHYRSLLTYFVADLKSSPLLDVERLQGLTQLVQDSPPGYIEADDLLNILDAVAKRLLGTVSQSEDYSFHLTVAVSKVLGVMADQNVQELDRVLQHDPLGKALAGLRNHDNPFLRYQAIYGSQTLQWVPNNESQVQRSLRLFAGMATGLVKAADVIQLDFNGFLGRLQDLQEAADETLDIVKAGIEDLNAMMENGQELAECLKGAFGSKQKGLWYISLRAAQELVQQGQLADFNTLVCEAPSHQGYMFQWGICQLLGDIAVDPSWDRDTREKAIRFLGEIFATTTLSNIRRWILTILDHISMVTSRGPFLDATVEEAIKTGALATISNLDKKSGEEVFPFPYLLGQRLPQPKASALLHRFNKTADLELKLLKIQSEIGEGGYEIYIPLMSKASLQDSGEKLDPLEDRVASFLLDKKEVMLILGDSGAGKSTYNRHLERKMWAEYQPGGAIPLFIDLKAMGRLDEQDIVKRKLAQHGFTNVEIQELKEHRRVILICDGYDECRQWVHLHSRVKEERWRSFQIVVTCRIQYLTPAYRNYFVPRPAGNQSVSEVSALSEEAVIVPFKSNQIEDFIVQFRETKEAKDIFDDRPVWGTETYKENLSALTELVKNPFMLKLALVTLPSIAKSDDTRFEATLTRFSLYDAFVQQHFEREVRRLGDLRVKMSEVEVAALCGIEDDFVIHGMHFSMQLAHSVFIEQGGVNVVEYSAADSRSWKAQFFGPKATADVNLLRQSCQLVSYSTSGVSSPGISRSIGLEKTIFSFVHRSILEFFYSCRLCDHVEDLRDMDGSNDESRYSDLSVCLDPTSDISLLAGHPLNQRSIVSESSIVHFLVEHANANPQFKDQLHAIVNLSKTTSAVSQASANAMTILVQAGVQFNRCDLRGIRIPDADLSGGYFDHAQLQDADMAGANLTKTWLRCVDFSRAQMVGVHFGERPYFEAPEAWSIALSPDKQILLLGFVDGTIKVLDTADWSTHHTLLGHTDVVWRLTFSSTGHQIASGSWDADIRIWDLQDDANSFVLQGHTDHVNALAFSPDGRGLVSGSWDMTVRVWNLDSKSCTFVLNGHTTTVSAVAWSPDGKQIASGGADETIRLWQASSGILEREIVVESGTIWSLLYIPSSQRLVAGTDSGIHIRDLQTKNDPIILKGHTNQANSLGISPDGRWIVSAGDDKSAKVWSERTGELVYTFQGHSGPVFDAAFLNNQELVSLGMDGTLQVWELSKDTEQKGTRQKRGHKGYIAGVAYSPDGQTILSGSYDETVREWDAETGSPGPVIQYQSSVSQATYSPDGKQIAIAALSDKLKLIVRESGADITAVSMQEIKNVCSLAYSPYSLWLATGDTAGLLKVWNLQSGAVLCTLEGHTDWINGVAFAPDGLTLVSWSEDRTIRFWDASDNMSNPVQTEILNIHAGALVFSPCGTMIAWGDFKANKTDEGPSDIHIWDVQTMQEQYVLEGHSDVVFMSLAWSSEWIVSGGTDGTVRLWKSQMIESTSSWNCMATIRGTMGPVLCIAWNPVVPLEFASGSWDSSLCVWKVTEEEDGRKTNICLKWGVSDRLMAQDAEIKDAVGLDDMQRKLLQQYGAIDETTEVVAREHGKY